MPRKPKAITVQVIDIAGAKPKNPNAITTRDQRLALNDRKARERLVDPPPTLVKGEEAQWVTDRAAALEPWAVRELEEQLLYSRDSRERRSAADKIIDMNGHGKAATPQGSAPIMVVMNVQQGQMPWHRVVNAEIAPNERRPLPSGTVIEGTAKEG